MSALANVLPDFAREEEAWLRRRARDLTLDPGLADDLVQDVLLEFVKSGDAAVERRRAWMNRVLRNRVLRVHRTRDRVLRREERAARDERLPSAAEPLERSEARYDVKEAILGLDWLDRETLFLTHYRDFRAQDLALHWDVPLPTAKSRLRRALERLRDVLLARGIEN